MRKLTKADLKVPAALIALSLVPTLGGIARLHSIAGKVTPDNARFLHAPAPVILHVISATLFCLLGAFQFSPAVRVRWPAGHRLTGRLLGLCGLAAGFTGIWMTALHAIPTSLQGPLLYIVRVVVGSAMVAAILIAWRAILRRDVRRHEAFMIRAYALGQGAGTQVLVLAPWTLITGQTGGPTRDLLMTLAWAINIAAAEWIIKRRTPSAAHAPDPHGRDSPLRNQRVDALVPNPESLLTRKRRAAFGVRSPLAIRTGGIRRYGTSALTRWFRTPKAFSRENAAQSAAFGAGEGTRTLDVNLGNGLMFPKSHVKFNDNNAVRSHVSTHGNTGSRPREFGRSQQTVDALRTGLRSRPKRDAHGQTVREMLSSDSPRARKFVFASGSEPADDIVCIALLSTRSPECSTGRSAKPSWSQTRSCSCARRTRERGARPERDRSPGPASLGADQPWSNGLRSRPPPSQASGTTEFPAKTMPRGPRSSPIGEPRGQSGANQDPAEVALADALMRASAAAQWDLVAQLARELQARREVAARAAKRDPSGENSE